MLQRCASAVGSGGINVAYSLARTNSGYLQLMFPITYLKNFKKMRILTAQEWLSETDSDISSEGTVLSSISLYVNGTSTATLTNSADLLVSSLNLPASGTVNLSTSVSAFTVLPIKLFND